VSDRLFGWPDAKAAETVNTCFAETAANENS
jgi:hypothetical protein